MPILIVVSNPRDWPLEIPGVEIISGRAYRTDPAYSNMRGAKVFNLCRSYRYQSIGYYVSLLAEARGHKPLPNVTTIANNRFDYEAIWFNTEKPIVNRVPTNRRNHCSIFKRTFSQRWNGRSSSRPSGNEL